MTGAVFHRSYSSPQQFSAADVIVGAEGKPGNKVPGGGPLGHVSAYLTEQLQGVFF
jgi:hypothetical protein